MQKIEICTPLIQKHDMDLPGIYMGGCHFIPLKRIIDIYFRDDNHLEIWYEGAEHGSKKMKPYCTEISNTSPDYDRISKWVQNQDVISDAVAQLEERIEQLEDKVNELEYSPTPGAKFLAAQDHYSSLAREQKE